MSRFDDSDFDDWGADPMDDDSSDPMDTSPSSSAPAPVKDYGDIDWAAAADIVIEEQQPKKVVKAKRSKRLDPNRPKPLENVPLDCLEAILDRVPKRELPFHRAVCRKWSTVIEGMCARKGKIRLLIYDTQGRTLFNFINRSFFDTLKAGQFIFISVERFITNRSTNSHIITGPERNFNTFLLVFLPFLCRMFPRPAQVIASIGELSTKCTQHFLAEVFAKWAPFITTLHLNYNTDTEESISSLLGPCTAAINSCHALKRLDIGLGWDIAELRPTLGRLEHFSVFTDDYRPYLGPNCSRLWGVIYPSDIYRWNPGPDWFARITHLRIEFQFDIRRLLRRFTSLKVLVLNSASYTHDFLDELAPLTKLVELHLEEVPFETVRKTPGAMPMPNVRKVKFHDLYVKSGRRPGTNKHLFFFTALATYFPGVEHLMILNWDLRFKKFSAEFKPLFPNLRSYQFDKYKDGKLVVGRKIKYFN